ncbi:MAG: tetratricopeptide repeat protein [Cyanobacteria bacterium P01_A01_bin.80]
MKNLAKTLQKAIQHCQSKRFAEAERIYRQVLDTDPQQEEALYGLGVIALEKGQYHHAENFLKTALHYQPEFAQALFSLGNLRQAQGKLNQAVEYYQKALSFQPEAVAVHNCLGGTLQQQGKLEEAVTCYYRALEIQPNSIEIKANLGNILNQQKKLSPEEQANYADLNLQFALGREKAGDFKTAELYYQQAVALQPDLVKAHHKLGDVLQKQGKLELALKSYQQAIKIKPDHANAYDELGNILQRQSRYREAVGAYTKALEIQPNLVASHNNLGNLFKKLNQFDAAIESFKKAITIEPNIDCIHYNLGLLYKEQNKLEAAIAAFKKALEVSPKFARAKLGICISQLPIIYSTVDEIESRRNRYRTHLQKLAQNVQLASKQERAKLVEAVGALQPFYLTYQGLNDRDLQRTYGSMICKIMSSRYPQYSKSLPIPDLDQNQKIRVGIVSRFFYRHSNWKIPIKGWVENLDKSEFELFGYYTGSKRDEHTLKAASVFDKFVQGNRSVEQWCQTIAEDKLHILIFPEFGMDPTTINLGCLRLAPIQMTSWGHPETSGLPTIDYYLSSDLMESEKAQENYTEKLVRLPNLSIHYTPLEIPVKEVSKTDIGLEEDDILFWCCQSLYKYLPNHDDVFPLIARGLSNAKFVFIQHESEDVIKVFRQRLSDAFEQIGLNYQDYCLFLPRMQPQMFAGISNIADVFLDSIGWSGCNSSLESVAHNLPIVTLPGDLMRGRHSMAILKMMGIEDTIAFNKEEYVQIAIRLGQNSQYRQHISEQVAENKHKLYGDLEPVRALEAFMLEVVNKPRRFDTQEIAQIFQLAAQHHQNRCLDEAQKLYYQVIEKQPQHSEALYGLGIIAQQQGKSDEAEKFLNLASEFQPKSVKIWFALGNLRCSQGQMAQAELAYQKAITLRPDAGAIYNNLGYTLEEQGKWEEAIAAYQKALEFQPNCREADVNLGNILHTQGKLSSEKQGYYAQLNFQLGNARKQLGDCKTATVYYQKAVNLSPDFEEAYYNLGMVLQAQRHMKEAMAAYDKALKIKRGKEQAV